MTDEENKKSIITDIMVITIAIVIGSIIVHYLLKSQTITSAIAPSSIQTFNTSVIENRLDSIEQRLQQLQIQPPQQLQTQQITQPTPQQTNTNTNTNTLYKNNENWEIIRGKDGFISKLNVLRDVKTNK